MRRYEAVVSLVVFHVVSVLGCGGSPGPVASSPSTATPVASATPASPQTPLTSGFLVASRGSDRILRYDSSGAPQGTFAVDAALLRPVGVTFGPDADLYAAVGDTDRVMRFNGTTGASRGVFTRGATIQSPRNINFGPDGFLYVADGFLNQILRFDGASGVFDRVFIQDPALNGPTSFTFGPDGNLYVVSVLTNRVLRFDGATGASLGAFATTNLALPHDVSFGPDANLYVTNSDSGIVQRFRGDTGAYIGAFVTDSALRQPLGMAWGPDGNLYVANQGANEIRRYDGVTGASLGAIVTASAGGLTSPSFLAFIPAPALSLAAAPDSARGGVLLRVSGAKPGARLLLIHGTPGGSGAIAECSGLSLGLGAPIVDQARAADESGNTVAAIPGARGQSLAFVAVDASRCIAPAPVVVLVP